MGTNEATNLAVEERPVDGGQVIARTPSYAEATRIVDDLSDRGFSVDRVKIVGSGLHSIEQVTGRMTKGRAALAGAGSGAWFGLFIGLLFSLFVIGPAWWAMLLWSIVIGAVFGAVFGFIGHWATRGRRDFSSIHSVQADRYDVVVEATHADEALRLIGQR